MLASSTANRDSYEVTTPADTDMVLTRLFNAPRRLVFEAMTKPAGLSYDRLEDLVAELQR
jgi:hypothetical protein